MAAKHVAFRHQLRLAWLRFHKHAYYPCGRGEGYLDDSTYDTLYRHLEEEVGPGCRCVETGPPPMPEWAAYREEADIFNLPVYDILEQDRLDRKKGEK